jgi:hypothetical protein
MHKIALRIVEVKELDQSKRRKKATLTTTQNAQAVERREPG